MTNTAISELEELGAEKVSGVGAPANGTPWLLLKAVEPGDAPTPSPESPHTESAEADAQEKEMTGAAKAEADEIEEMLTKARFKGFCGVGECDVCKEMFGPLQDQLVEKAKLDTDARHALPDSAFAYIDSKGGRHLPVHDESHAKNASSRFNQTHFESSDKKSTAARKIRGALRRFGVHAGTDTNVAQATKEKAKKGKKGKVAKSPGVPAWSVEVHEGGHLATATSGLAGGMTAGERQDHTDPSFAHGGESSYNIPEEGKVNTNPPAPEPMDRPGESQAVSHVGKESWEIEVVAKQNWVTLDDDQGSGEAGTPGSPEWEDVDADTLDAVAGALSLAQSAVLAIRDRENMEKEASAESLAAARDRLTELLGVAKTTAGNGPETSEEASMATVTKEELDAHIEESAAKAAKKEAKKTRKAMKGKMKKLPKKIVAAMAEKNANNGGDVTAEHMAGQVHGEHKSNDVNSVPDGGHVDGQYVNKGKKGSKRLAKALEKNTALLQKMAQRPQRGGPVLDGQGRGAGVTPASESRIEGSVAKSEGEQNIEKLEKSLEASTDPMARDQISRELTLARLRAGHEAGQI